MSAFRATYSDFRLVRGRKVVQFVFEVPLELAGEAYQVLGGMPNPASEVWCGIARLDPSRSPLPAETAPRPERNQPAAPGGKSPAQIAGALCAQSLFQDYLLNKHVNEWWAAAAWIDGRDEIAAECVRKICNVESRSELTDQNAEWNGLKLAYRLWLNERRGAVA